MGSTNYFQRYSQRENWLTNNTLLLLQYFYDHDAKRFEEFWESILGENSNASIPIGTEFEQQVHGKGSIPDGHIFQKGFSIIIEAKPHGNLDENQLINHIDAFGEAKEKILLAITKEPVQQNQSKAIKREIKNREETINGNLHFATVTYGEIIEALDSLLMNHELSMQEILDDYEKICQEEKMLSTEKHTILTVSTGDSFNENMKYNIYYNPVGRSHNKNFRYMGIYTDKAIRGIGEIETVVGCNLVDDKLDPHEDYVDEFNMLTPEQKEDIKNIIKNTEYYSIDRGNKFFIVDNFHEVYYKKDSPGGMMGKRYFNLKDVEGFREGMSSKELANLLDEKTWS